MGRPRVITAEQYLAKRDAKMKAYQEKNKERLKAYRKDYYKKNKELILAKKRIKRENKK